MPAAAFKQERCACMRRMKLSSRLLLLTPESGMRAACLPAQKESDIAHLSVVELHDLRLHFVAELLKVLGVGVVSALGETFEGLRPFRLRVIDRPATIAAEIGRETEQLDFPFARFGGALDRGVNPLERVSAHLARH